MYESDLWCPHHAATTKGITGQRESWRIHFLVMAVWNLREGPRPETAAVIALSIGPRQRPLLKPDSHTEAVEAS